LFGNDSRKKILLNAVDLNKFSIERYGNIRISDTFIHIGRYDDNKNQKFILDVFYQYKKLKPNALLKLVGYSLINVDYKTELYKKVDELKLKDSVEFLPHDSDIPFLMAQSEYMIFPSRSEGLPLVCLEAQAMGVKCFISDSVTKEVDLGLCEFISLNEDSNFWVKRIVDNKLDENNIQDKTKIGLDRYIGSIKRIYEGNLD
jgi:glycosyltransferase involved in cell wall biosynthesis